MQPVNLLVALAAASFALAAPNAAVVPSGIPHTASDSIQPPLPSITISAPGPVSLNTSGLTSTHSAYASTVSVNSTQTHSITAIANTTTATGPGATATDSLSVFTTPTSTGSSSGSPPTSTTTKAGAAPALRDMSFINKRALVTYASLALGAVGLGAVML